jgi:hypothetical protein
MAKYRINKHEITGKKGVRLFKNQVVDEKKFVDGSVDHLVSTGAISAVKAEDLQKMAEKASKKTEKDKKTSEKDKKTPENPE